MEWERVQEDGFVLIRVTQKALVRQFDWEALDLRYDSPRSIVAIDFCEAEFISSLFWEDCAGWERFLRRRGQQLALLNLDDTQKRMLGLLGDLQQALTFESLRELRDYVRSQSELAQDGVTEAEKAMLWSIDNG